MSDKNNDFWEQEQKNLTIEDEIRRLIDGNLQHAALGFIEYLNANNMTPRLWFGPGFWRIPWENNFLCGIIVEKGRWRFWFFKGKYEGDHGESFVKSVHEHVRPCISCTTLCKYGKDTKIFGKKFENTCFQFPIQYKNPDSDELEAIKELLEFWKEAAPGSDGWHVHG